MREQGRLIEWNDERGFGFITPLGGKTRIFVHVSQFPRDLRRPMATDLVTYNVGTDERNRAVAREVVFLAPTHARHEESRPLSPVELAVPAMFTVVLLVLVAMRAVPTAVLGLYALASIVAFAMYWQDKAAAMRGGWRTSESALIGIALIGGWPGAHVARHVFRHKTHKQPFRTFFWVTVCANCTFLALIVAALSTTPG